MTYPVALESGVWLLNMGDQFEENGIDVIENTRGEITAVTIEMDERLEGTWQTTEEDEELQQRLWSLFKQSNLYPAVASRMGAVFLREKKELPV